MKTEPIDAMGERIKELFEITAEDVTAIEANARRNEIIALAAFKKGQSSPKIKQLEWDFYGTYYSAETSVIDYMITQENDFIEKGGDCALWVNGFPISHSTLEEAKAAAQADFERRVMECLDLKAQQKQALIDMMRGDEELGLYDDNPKNHGYER